MTEPANTRFLLEGDLGKPGWVASLTASGAVPSTQLGSAFRITGAALSGSGAQTAPVGLYAGMIGTAPALAFASGTASFTIDNAVTSVIAVGTYGTKTTPTPALRIVNTGVRDIAHFRGNGSFNMRGRVNFGDEWQKDLPRISSLFNYTIWGPNLPPADPGTSGGNKAGQVLTIKIAGGFTNEASSNVVDPGFVFGANDFIISGTNEGDIAGLTDIWGRLSEVHLYTPRSTLTRLYGLIGEAAIEESAIGSRVTTLAAVHARGARIRAAVTVDTHYSLYVTPSSRLGDGVDATVTNDYAVGITGGHSINKGSWTTTGQVTSVAQSAEGGVRMGYLGTAFGIGISTGFGSTWSIANVSGTFKLSQPNVADRFAIESTGLTTIYRNAIIGSNLADTDVALTVATGRTLLQGSLRVLGQVDSVAQGAAAGARLGYDGSNFGMFLSTGGGTTVGALTTATDFRIVRPNVNDVFAINYATRDVTLYGKLVLANAATATTATTGSASALPAAPVGYKIERINGTDYKIPYYAN